MTWPTREQIAETLWGSLPTHDASWAWQDEQRYRPDIAAPILTQADAILALFESARAKSEQVLTELRELADQFGRPGRKSGLRHADIWPEDWERIAARLREP